MCLRTVSLNLKFRKGANAYIGQGYKHILVSDLEKFGKIGVWKRATGDYDYKRKSLGSSLVSSSYYYGNGEKYHPGFHIFTKQKDAEVYSSSNKNIYLVEFKNVVAFGTNSVGSLSKAGDCVVAEYMKIVRKLA